MEYRQIGNNGPQVSVICLGTMTWGEQNSEQEAHQQLDYAVEHGVNFIDTAEMYPVPPRAETQGRTEAFIGSWLARRSDRDRLIIATKASGPGMQSYLRGGPQLTRKHLEQALNDSLARLQTDYIDLYQVHWPARSTNFFGKLGYVHDPGEEAAPIEEAPAENMTITKYASPPSDGATPIEETLAVLDEMVEAGKVRAIGLSNETPWGTMAWLHAAERNGQARVVAVQNPYGLLNRVYEIGLAEISHRENVGLLAYSPLGFGVLSGKYLDDRRPPKGRLTLFPAFDRYTNENGAEATRRYVEIARAAGLDPAQMALAYVNTRSFLAANIIGATTMEQLAANIASIDLKLSGEVLEEIEKVHTAIPNPCP